MARSKQQVIAGLMDRLDPMCESPSMTGMSTLIGGGPISTRGDSTLDTDMDSVSAVMIEPSCEGGDCDNEEGSFTATQLRIAKRFIELMGGAEKARAIVDKVDECEECLDIIDDDVRGESDSSMIDKISGMLPGLPDLPMELSNLYNPAAGGSTM